MLEIFPCAGREVLRLLEGMLEFNPNKRISAEEALKSKFFDKDRLLENENWPTHPVEVGFDMKEMSARRLKALVKEEMQKTAEMGVLFE